MKQNVANLTAAYRRRTFWAAAGLALVSTGLGVAPNRTIAQDTDKPANAGSSQENKRPGRTNKSVKQGAGKKSDGPTLHVVPLSGSQSGKGTLDGKVRSVGPPGLKPNAPPITTVPGADGGPGRGAPLAATSVSFDFRGADITNVLKFYAQMSGATITADKDLSGPVTIIAPKQVTLDEAFKILQSVLGSRGFTALQDGNVINVLPMDRAVGSTTLLNSDPDDPSKIDPRNQVMTQVFPLQNVDAEALAKELAPLITKGASLIGSPGTNSLILTDTASNVQRFLDLVDALDQGSTSTDMVVYQLKRAEASAIADIINNLYKQLTTRGRGAPAGQPGQPGFQPPQPGQQPPTNGRPAVIAVADTRTNTVIVVASPENQEKIARTIIGRLDDDDSNTLDTRLRKIKFADAVTVANLVNTVLSNSRGGASASSSGGSSFQQRAFGGFGGFFGGGQQQQNDTVTTQSTDPFGKVAADPRTNSVLITATADKMIKINELIDKVDVDVPVETTTFVFPLKNAQADDVTYALGQAFGTSNNNGGFGNFNSFFIRGGGGGNGSQRQPIQRRLGSNNGLNSFRSVHNPNNVPPGPPNAPDGGASGDGSGGAGDASAAPEGVQGVMTPNGFVPTETSKDGTTPPKTRQFFGGFFGGRQRGLGQGGGPQYGRGRTGSYSNLLQLQNNVFVTPSPNGDSIIVTTTPDNYQALKEIIDQLDVVQRQVMIEVIVAEVTLDQDEKLGLSLGSKFSQLFRGSNTAQGTLNTPASGSSSTFDALAPGSQFIVSGSNYSLLVQALKSDNKVRILSTPSVFTSNNQQADIEITTQIPYITAQDSGFFGGSNVSNNVQFLKVGFTLNVTPRITRNGLVTIDVQQEASDLLRFDTLGTGVSALRAPVVNDRYADTSVTAQDGETIVLGGLIRDSKALNINKIPLLSDIPLIGQFLRSREVTHNKVELILFLTPHVVNSIEEARELARKKGAKIMPDLPDLKKEQPNLDTSLPNNRTGAGNHKTGGNGDASSTNKAAKPMPNNGTGTSTPDTTPH